MSKVNTRTECSWASFVCRPPPCNTMCNYTSTAKFKETALGENYVTSVNDETIERVKTNRNSTASSALTYCILKYNKRKKQRETGRKTGL